MLELSARPAEAILGRTVTVTLGGTRYVLPVLTIAGNRRWNAELDAETAELVDGLTASGDDVGAILARLATQPEKLGDLLYAYDTSGVLPPRAELEEVAYEDELMAAVQGVWQAANPLAVMALTMAAATTTSASSPPTNGSPPSTAGPRPKSKTSSRTSNSSPTSTRRRTGSRRAPASTSSPA